MARFAYTATEASGRLTTGRTRAATREAAELALYERELRGIRLVEKKSLLKAELTAPRVKRAEVMHQSRQLGAFIRAGLPLIDAVHTLGEESRNSSVRRMMAQVEEGLRAGERLSDCFDAHPK